MIHHTQYDPLGSRNSVGRPAFLLTGDNQTLLLLKVCGGGLSLSYVPKAAVKTLEQHHLARYYGNRAGEREGEIWSI